MTPLGWAAIILVFVGFSSGVLLLREFGTANLRARLDEICQRPGSQETPAQARILLVRSHSQANKYTAHLMRYLRFNPDISQQNLIDWRLVFAIASTASAFGLFYGHALVGWPAAIVLMPVEAFLVARVIFGWERAHFQKALLEQIPDVMALISRAVSAGIPLSESLRNVAREAPNPSGNEFSRVMNEVAVGQPLEHALWKLYERVELPEYAFFAITIGLQAQTGGSLVETLTNLQDLVRKRVALSRRGKALAAEARMSAIILGALPFVMSLLLASARPGFLDFFFHDPTGKRLLLAFAGLMSGGILVMRQLIRRSLAP